MRDTPLLQELFINIGELFSAAGDGEAIIVAVKEIFRVCTEKITHEIVKSDKTGNLAIAVGGKEKEGIGAEKSIESLFKRIIIADIIKSWIEDVGDAARLADI